MKAVALIGILIVLVIGPYLYPVDPLQTRPEIQFRPPNKEHLLGTDLLGRDVLSRALHGGRYTFLIAGMATLLSVCLGIPLGMLAVVKNPVMNHLAIIVINSLLAIPGLLIALVMLTTMGRGLLPLASALGLAQMAPIAHTTRAAILAVQSRDYIVAAHNLGARQAHIFRHYLLPNALPTIIAYVGIIFSYMILNGAALTFLGVGIEPGIPEWGVMLAESRAAFRVAPWIGLAPGLGIMTTVWLINALTDNLIQLQ